jgi:pyruvate/2-oxoglutarate dehydrogenase complex dihydrolipoamide acyltransferase (E2) component
VSTSRRFTLDPGANRDENNFDMKKLFLATIAVALAHFTPALADAGSAASTAAAAPAVSSSAQPVTAAAPANLPSGCQDVVKLSRAQVSEDIILNFIHNSGATYNLSAKDILELKNQGVSDRVLKALLENGKTTVAAQPAAPAAPPAIAQITPANPFPDTTPAITSERSRA